MKEHHFDEDERKAKHHVDERQNNTMMKDERKIKTVKSQGLERGFKALTALAECSVSSVSW